MPSSSPVRPPITPSHPPPWPPPRRKHPILLQGPTSSGKTSLVGYLAAQTGHKLVRINNHEHTDLQVRPGGHSKTHWNFILVLVHVAINPSIVQIENIDPRLYRTTIAYSKNIPTTSTMDLQVRLGVPVRHCRGGRGLRAPLPANCTV